MLLRDLEPAELKQLYEDLDGYQPMYEGSYTGSLIVSAMAEIQNILEGRTEPLREHCNREIPPPDLAWWSSDMFAVRHGERPAVRAGERGPVVSAIQEMLLHWGCMHAIPSRDVLPIYGADKIFGTETRRAVRELQRAADLNPDGRVGPLTIRALDRLVYPDLFDGEDSVPDDSTPMDVASYDRAFVLEVFGVDHEFKPNELLGNLTYEAERKAIEASPGELQEWVGLAKAVPINGPKQEQRAQELIAILESNLGIASTREKQVVKPTNLHVMLYTLHDTSIIKTAKTYVADGKVDEAWAIQDIYHMQQILNAVAARNGSGSISKLDIFGHGAPGSYQFGSEMVNAENMSGEKVPGSLSQAIANGATISFLGCNAAKGEEGREFIRAMGAAFLDSKSGKLVGNTGVAQSFVFDITPIGPVTYSWPSMTCTPAKNCP